MGGAASVPNDPNRRIEVICAGYSRTGTSSMAVALEKLLDGPVCHGGAQLFGREDVYVKKWIEVYRVRHDKPRLMKKLAEVTRGFVAIADTPGNNFIEELTELYPEAKVIDIHRDPEKWKESFKTITSYTDLKWLHLFLAPMPGWRWFPVALDCMIERSLDLMDGRTIDVSGLLEFHHQYVRDVVDKDKLSTVELSDGWVPLCKILDKPLPSEPFPRINDSEAVNRLARRIIIRTALVWLCILLVLVAISVWAFRRLYSSFV